MNKLYGEWLFFKLRIECFLWKLRGLKTCEEHGFCGQSWISGKCKNCENKTRIVPIVMCGYLTDKERCVLKDKGEQDD